MVSSRASTSGAKSVGLSLLSVASIKHELVKQWGKYCFCFYHCIYELNNEVHI